MVGMATKDRLAAWALRHALRDAGHAGGVRLVAVDEQGGVVDLGVYAVRELEGLAWAVGVAYRSSSIRWERTRLAGLRQGAGRLALGVRELAREKGVQEG